MDCRPVGCLGSALWAFELVALCTLAALLGVGHGRRVEVVCRLLAVLFSRRLQQRESPCLSSYFPRCRLARFARGQQISVEEGGIGPYTLCWCGGSKCSHTPDCLGPV